MVQSVGNVFFDISDQDFTIDASTGIEAMATALTNFTVYPNPTNGLINVMVTDISDLSSILLVKDVIGRTVIEQTLSTMNGQQEVALDLSGKPNGVYMIELVTENGSTIKKIIKQ